MLPPVDRGHLAKVRYVEVFGIGQEHTYTPVVRLGGLAPARPISKLRGKNELSDDIKDISVLFARYPIFSYTVTYTLSKVVSRR